MFGTRLLDSILMTAVLASFSGTAFAAVSVPDPAGDTFGSGSVQIDIVSVTTQVVAGSLDFNIVFAGAVSPPSSSLSNSVVGFLDLDTDQNPATGVSTRFGAPPTPTVIPGIEFYVDLLSELFTPGMVDVINASTGLPSGSAAISYGATSFSLTLPLSLIGGDDGFLNWGLIVGTFSEATDQATGSTGTSIPPPEGVPEPASAVVWLFFALTAVICTPMLRRQARALSAHRPA